MLSAVVAVNAAGCADDASAPPADAPFAIEAWIDNDGYPTVVLTRVLVPTERPVDLSLLLVRWAKVTISDGERTVVLTGGVDHGVFPPFSYKSYAMQGEVGRTYTVVAEYEGTKATATATILPPPVISGLRFSQVSDSVYSGELAYSVPDNTDGVHLVAFTKVRGVDDRHYPAYLGTVTVPKGQHSGVMPLCRGKHLALTDAYSPNFTYGDSVDVILATVEPLVYAFWTDYQQQVYYGNNLFISAESSPTGNMVGGYGVFSARGSAQAWQVVE